MAGGSARDSRLIAAAQDVLATDPAVSEWRALSQFDPRLVSTVVLAEDRHFWRHHGIDWSAVRAATTKNIREGRVRFGASTIPMQVVRMLRRWSKRSFARKLGEALLAWWLVARHERETVLEVYLNLAPFAPGTRGAAAGSARLGQDPGQVTLFEATLLAAALSDPEIAPGSTPRFARWLRYKQQRLVDELAEAGMVDSREASAASAEIEATWAS
jgi:membrane peptidoglycan carboxypeptidase